MLEVQRGIKIDVELWIDAGDSSLRQMKLDSEAPTFVSDQEGSRFEGSSTFSTFVKFTDLNAPISIERPVGADGVLEQGWSAASSGGPGPDDPGRAAVAYDSAVWLCCCSGLRLDHR